MHHYPSMFGHPKEDTVAGVVVFLVALPLCLGIAIACGVPPVSGLVAGVVGGIVVPWISRSPLSVTGPAAGLTSIVLAEVSKLGLEGFLMGVVVGGVLQFLMGVIRAGRFSALVPSAVIKGMLAAIGITIVWRQLPVAFGAAGGVFDIPSQLHPGAAFIAILSLVMLYGWKYTPLGRYPLISPALVVVVTASLVAEALRGSGLALAGGHYVDVPLGGIQALASALPRPDFSMAMNPASRAAGLSTLRKRASTDGTASPTISP